MKRSVVVISMAAVMFAGGALAAKKAETASVAPAKVEVPATPLTPAELKAQAAALRVAAEEEKAIAAEAKAKAAEARAQAAEALAAPDGVDAAAAAAAAEAAKDTKTAEELKLKAAGAKDGAAGAKNDATEGTDKPYPSSDGTMVGDMIKLRANVEGFTPYGAKVADAKRCAPANSTGRITADDGNVVGVRFTYVPIDADNQKNFLLGSQSACPTDRRVVWGIQYTIQRGDLLNHDHNLIGFQFGGMVVPFKYYMGGDKRLSSSSTIAPYMGVSIPLGLGLTVTPVVSAGLGLVPVDPSGDENDGTKAAFSSSVGFMLKSKKNSAWTAGFLVGRDFVSKKERGDDDTVNKAWTSLFVGYALQ